MEGLRIALALACHRLCPRAPRMPRPIRPSRSTIVVTLAAGGAADVIARCAAQRLTEEWGQPVVVENKGGANNQVGRRRSPRSAPDGYTLLLTPEHTFTVNPYLYRKLSYDPAKDFIPVTGLVSIVAGPGGASFARVQNVLDLIAAASIAGRINYGSLRVVAREPHLSMSLAVHERDQAQRRAQTSAPALTDVIAGHVPMMFVSTGLIVQAWKAGQLRPLGVGSPRTRGPVSRAADRRRDPAGLYRLVWFGLFAPAERRGTSWSGSTTRSSACSRTAISDRFLAPNLMSRCRARRALSRTDSPGCRAVAKSHPRCQAGDRGLTKHVSANARVRQLAASPRINRDRLLERLDDLQPDRCPARRRQLSPRAQRRGSRRARSACVNGCASSPLQSQSTPSATSSASAPAVRTPRR